MNKPLILFHGNCPDGFGAAFAAWLKFGDDAEYVPLGYDAGIAIGQLAAEFHTYRLVDMKGNFYVISTPEEKRDVYILDFSFKKPIMDFIFAHARRVVWLDHHKSAFEMWLKEDSDFPLSEFLTDPQKSYAVYGPGKDIRLNNWKSGAVLAWEYFNPEEEIPMAIRMIDDRDRWQFKISGTKEFSAWLFSLQPWSFSQWAEIGMGDEYPTHECYDQGEAILRAHDQNVQSVVNRSARACRIVVRGTESIAGCLGEYTEHTAYPGLTANCPPHLTSDVGHALANQSGTFGLCWTLGKTGSAANCSLRSNGDYDVSAIAKSFGGGGHRNAAGFEVDIQTLLGWLK